ncbi:MAG: TolC family protein [Planctomycetota bacterium]
MNSRTSRSLRTALSLLFASGTIAGCASPFHISTSDFAATPDERIRAIPPLDIEQYRVDESPAAPDASYVSRLTTGEQVELDIADVRAAAIANNLDIRVARLDPAIAEESVNEEAARFDSVFRVDARYDESDAPAATTLNATEANVQSFTPTLTKPLLTGGTVDVSLPTSRVSNDNAFTTLNPSYQSDLVLRLTQPLLRGAGRTATTAQLRIAGINRSVASVRARSSIATTLTSVDRSYWELWAARQQLELRIEEFEVAREVLAQARRLVDAGAVAEIEIARAESGVADRVSLLLILEQAVLQRQRELKRAMNTGDLLSTDDSVLIPLSDPAPLPLELDTPSLVDVAMTTRPELLELELELLADTTRIALARNDALPQLDASFTYRRNGLGAELEGALNQIYQDEFEDYGFGLTASMPIGNNAAEARIQRALLNRMSRVLTKDARQQTITQDVLDAVERLRSDWQRILAARQAVTLNARTLEAEQRQFTQGISTSVDVLEAAARLASARAEEIRSIADYELAQVALAQATGTVLGRAAIDLGQPERP